ncbi:alpha/beta hydrolase [Amycolatopsis sp. CA-230715]|uniref:alpha/beta hydrolase n=1 Tax=Amycolatopsis sp. CA-230715 TaxID=2745196 RepID=UPI001C0370AA|nr:alpha/beta fold hydrolase [Amycolatopsis sp. CA-230715]QWF83526.1 Pyrethroid hydrolase [Amycolatopsis sp. CA-230715]
MITFVLVHGSWHDGSAWNAVVPRLAELGHVAHSPTIAGHGKGADKAVDHDDCVRSIRRFIVDHDLADVVLVGHSFGGTVIARVAEEIPERLRRLVFWGAFVPLPGTSVNDDLPPAYRELFARLAGESDDNTVMLPFPIWREAFIQDADLDRATAAYQQLSPTPYQPFVDRLDLSKFPRLEIAKSYLNCTDDTALPPGEWGWHPRMSGRLGLHRLVQSPGSHEVVFTNPRLLAEKIVHAGRD